MHDHEPTCLLEEGQESGRAVKVVKMPAYSSLFSGKPANNGPTMGQRSPLASCRLHWAAPSGGKGWGIWGCTMGGKREGAEAPEVTREPDLRRGFPLLVVRRRLCHPAIDALFNLVRSL